MVYVMAGTMTTHGKTVMDCLIMNYDSHHDPEELCRNAKFLMRPLRQGTRHDFTGPRGFMRRALKWPDVEFEEKWPRMIPAIFRNQLETDTTREYIFGVNTDALSSTVVSARPETMVTGVTYESGVSAEDGSAVVQPTLEEFMRRDPAIEAVAVDILGTSAPAQASAEPSESSGAALLSPSTPSRPVERRDERRDERREERREERRDDGP